MAKKNDFYITLSKYARQKMGGGEGTVEYADVFQHVLSIHSEVSEQASRISPHCAWRLDCGGDSLNLLSGRPSYRPKPNHRFQRFRFRATVRLPVVDLIVSAKRFCYTRRQGSRVLARHAKGHWFESSTAHHLVDVFGPRPHLDASRLTEGRSSHCSSGF